MSDQPKVYSHDEKLKAVEDTTRVPNAIINYNDVSIQARFLWVELWKRCWGKDNNKAWPGMDTIAENMGVTEETVRKYRRELEDENLVTVERKGLGKTNRYYLHYPEPKKIGDQNPKFSGIRTQENNGSHSKKYKGNKNKGKKDNSNKESSSNLKEKYNEHAPLNGRGLDYDKIKVKWNSQVPEDVQIRSMTDHRKEKLRTRFKEPDFNLDEIIEEVKQSDFLVKELNPNLFTWLVKNQDNYTKTLEGSYRDNDNEKHSDEQYNIVG